MINLICVEQDARCIRIQRRMAAVPKPTELSKQGLEAWKGLLLAHATLVEQIDREMARVNLLPLDWYDALLALEDSPNHRMKMSELADQVLLSKSGLTRLVDRLEAKGYI